MRGMSPEEGEPQALTTAAGRECEASPPPPYLGARGEPFAVAFLALTACCSTYFRSDRKLISLAGFKTPASQPRLSLQIKYTV